MNRRLLKIVLPLGVVMAVIVAVAVAFFSSTGDGSGTGSAQSSAQAVTIAGATPTTALFPGGNGSVGVHVTNPNDFRVKIDSLVLDTSQGTNGFAVDSGHADAGCTTSVLSFTTQDNSSAGWFVPAKVGGTDGSLSVDLTDAISMASSAADACQGATFTVYLKPGT